MSPCGIGRNFVMSSTRTMPCPLCSGLIEPPEWQPEPVADAVSVPRTGRRLGKEFDVWRVEAHRVGVLSACSARAAVPSLVVAFRPKRLFQARRMEPQNSERLEWRSEQLQFLVLLAPVRHVVVKDVDFPHRLVRVGDPDLRLVGVAALHVVLLTDAQRPRLSTDPGSLAVARR